MKLSLQLKLGQQLAMTPQLQQAIKLLQLSTLDLQQEIHQALESNPMLELIEGIEDDENSAKETDTDSEPASQTADSPDSNTLDNPEEDYWQNEIPKDLEVDSNWDDIYTNSPPPSQSFEADDFDFESRNSVEETLQDHLLWQLNLTPMSESDEAIAMAIIDAIDPNGWLTVDLESILAGFDPALEIELDEVVAVLHRIQQFDPIGVGYRNLSECLLIQLNHLGENHPPKLIENAKLIVRDYIELLGHRDYALLMRKTKLKEAELAETITVIESLDPRPGANIAPPSTNYVVPDVIVTKDAESGKWKVELNPETAPRIRINSSYASLVKRADTSSDNNFLRDNLQ
ncbi:MAG: RNA polymerase factor sigma-54, partial [Pseudohongiellaceae bacterium]